MTGFDYKVIPAPTKGLKAQGLKTAEARFARTVEDTLNAQASEGWEYMRTDILPSDERQGLTGSQTVYRTLMLFRRAKASEDSAAGDVIQNAQDMAEAVSPGASAPARREPSINPIRPSRGDPAPVPDVPAPSPVEPGPAEPSPAPDTPSPDTPDPETPKKD
jgi:hypothetical protein